MHLSNFVSWSLSLNDLLVSSAVLVGLWKLSHVVQALIGPLRQFISEHDVMWEDYNMRTGGSYRRSTGRGAPPDPEEHYKKHPESVAEALGMDD